MSEFVKNVIRNFDAGNYQDSLQPGLEILLKRGAIESYQMSLFSSAIFTGDIDDVPLAVVSYHDGVKEIVTVGDQRKVVEHARRVLEERQK